MSALEIRTRLGQEFTKRADLAMYRAGVDVRYEELVNNPQEALAGLGTFIGHELDYERIQSSSIGSVKNPLTSFKEDLQQGEFTPVGRWKQKFSRTQLRQFEGIVGGYLQELGYALSDASPGAESSCALKKMRLIYRAYYPFKQWAKVHTPLSRWMVDYSAILIDK